MSLRVWSLRDDAPQERNPPYGALPVQNRQVGWATYDNPRGIRIDAIVHRDLASRAIMNVDGDLLAPLAPRVALSLGSSRHSDVGNAGILPPDDGARKFLFGLRLR